MTTSAIDSSVLIVGASAAGIAVAEGLRRRGHSGPLTLLDNEQHTPYDRPPLSKQYLSGHWDLEQVMLRPQRSLDGLGAVFRLGHSASGLDVARRTVSVGNEAIAADNIVIATGVRARQLPLQHDLLGVHVLRSLDDARELRESLRSKVPTLVVGNGVLGSEIAAATVASGSATTLVGPEPTPMLAQLGSVGSALLSSRHEDAGVVLRGESRVRSLLQDRSSVAGAVLDDGTQLQAGRVIVTIGSTPNTEWLSDSGLDVSDGVLCDGLCRAAPGIWAVGDVARWRHEGLGRDLRLENRTNATEQAAAVTRNILDADAAAPYVPVPYFWSDQYGTKIQAYGFPGDADDSAVIEGSIEEGRFVALATRAGQPVGVLGWGMPKQARLASALLTDRFAGQAAVI
ncbi:NAD/ferredoxin-dependent reductase-like protein [Curtobacterium sp. PhB130]|uniref:NAD(P)/FAD-dependent oxidoreductase n=1 Tax=unclassified Curtobacterium TaxID=257496 RepID=UPI000F4B6099|nr:MULTISPECIES: FAD-dependent oxidoreductase [unclassified Curtobacterium]ROS76088.1 NAD/ferredoxin-dependent reductase-like protein [Curtobacterium sp. PhB130]TCK64215.1 NAD/ferredoxin-dependent reductase-like protein [Curtobacterium sp. PhB136]